MRAMLVILVILLMVSGCAIGRRGAINDDVNKACHEKADAAASDFTDESRGIISWNELKESPQLWIILPAIPGINLSMFILQSLLPASPRERFYRSVLNECVERGVN